TRPASGAASAAVAAASGGVDRARPGPSFRARVDRGWRWSASRSSAVVTASLPPRRPRKSRRGKRNGGDRGGEGEGRARGDRRGVRREDGPQHVIDREKSVHRAQLLEQGKPEAMIDKILPGKLDRFFKDMGGCLLEQSFFKDPEGKRTVLDEINAAIAVIGENIQVRRFTRYALGEGL